ncbi:MAG: Ig-like domain-containing protein [Treponema sp.]|nr:Ig-like domain-containing protein [Treponema sp.]
MSVHVYTKYFLPVLFSAALIPLVSCQVGLGAAVDTEAPTLQVTYPPASSVIKGTFTLAGTCDDDQGVSSIAVNVRNITTSASTPYTISSGEISGGTSWKLPLNTYDSSNTAYNGWQFPDGKYEITVTASDSSGHTSGGTARSVIIDNTPPVLILSSPLKTGTDEASTYGRTVKLAGDIADDNTVSSLAMTLYPYNTATGTLSAAGIFLDVTDFSQMSSDNPLVVAKYYTAAEAGTDTGKLALRTNYLKIYNDGSDSGADIDTVQTKTYYCGIILTDNAKTYTTPGDSGSGTGNATTVYYINNTENFYDKLMSESTYSLTALKLKNILNGTSSDYTAAQITAIKEILSAAGNSASSTAITAAASSKISINPSNDPHYSVSGYEIGTANTYADAETGYRSSTTGSSFTVSLSAGLDKYYIKPSSVSIVLEDTTKNTSQTVLAAGGWTDDDALSADYTFSLDATKYTLVSNDYYTIEVSGEDRNGNDLYPSNEDGYGFMLQNIYADPVVEFEDQSGNAFFGTSDVYYSASTIKNTVIPVKVATDGLSLDADTPLTVSISGSPSLTCTESYTGNNGYYYYYTITVTDIGTASTVSDKSRYTLSVTAEDAENDTGSATGYFYLDDKTPAAVISTVTPTVLRTADNAVCVNGTITVSGTVTESNLSSVVLTVSDTNGKSDAIDLGTVYSFSQAVDTTPFSGTLTLILSATDAVGNTGSTKASYIVDQTTDAPVITMSNADISVKEAGGITSGTNLFGTTSNNKLLGTISDDDGVAAVTVGYRDCGSVGSYTTAQVLSGGSSTTYSLSYTLPAAEKQYDILITVTDTKGETKYNSISKGFVLAVDAGAPVFSGVTPASSLTSYYSGKMAVSGTVTDGSGTVTLSAANVMYSDSSSASGASSTPALAAGAAPASGAAWTDTVTLPAASGQYKVIYTATDAYGQSATYAIAYSVDITPPSIALLKLDKNDISAVNKNLQQTSHTFTGTVSDTGGSGLSTVTYKVVNSSNVTVASGTASISNGTWSATIDMSSLPEGTYAITFTAADAADNTASTSVLTVYLDGTAPELSGVSAADTLISADEYTALEAGSGLLVNATAQDRGSGTVKLYVSTSSSSSSGSPAVSAVTTATTDSWTPETLYIPVLSFSSDGTYTYYVHAVDAAGNESVSDTLTVTVDRTLPTANIMSVTPTAVRTLDSVVCVNGTITVSGNASDTNLSSVVLTAADTGSHTSPVTVYTGTAYSFSQAVDTTQYSGTLTLTLTATDTAGNTGSRSVSYAIDQTTDAPKITLSNATTAITAAEAIKSAYTSGASITNIFGTTSNSSLLGTITDDDGIASVTIAYDTTSGGEYSNTILNNTVVGGSTSYSLSGASFSGLPQGLYYIKITVVDSKNETVFGTKTTSYFVVAVDNGAPTFSGVTPASSLTSYYSGTLAVSGTVTDGSGTVTLSAAHVMYSDSSSASGASSTPTLAAGAAPASGAAWTDTITLPAASGQYKVIYTATDAYGQSSTYAIAYSVDITPPSIYLKTLDKTSVSTADTAYLQKTSHTFTGTVSDTGGSGLSTVTYKAVNSSNETAASGTASISGGSWSAAIDMSSLTEGTYTVTFTAADAAGNTTSTPALTVYVDGTAPSTTLTSDAALYDTTGANGTETLTAGTTYITKNGFTLGGTITETNFSSAVLSIMKDGTKVSGVTSPTASGPWTYSQTAATDHSDDGLYVYTLTITDKAGNKTSETVSVRVDTTGPVITVTAPSADESVDSGTKTLRGTFADAGAGNKNIAYSIKNKAGTVLASGNTDQSGESWSFADASLGSTEGTVYLYMTATDILGNETTTDKDPVMFYFDKSAPDLSETGITVAGLTTNGSFTLTGKVWDTNSISKLEITTGSTTWKGSAEDSTVTVAAAAFSAIASEPSSANWSRTFTVGSGKDIAGDGTYMFTIVATDAADKTTTLYRTVKVDMTPPVLSGAEITTTKSFTVDSTDWYNTESIGVTATATDNVSGVSTVSYSTDNSTWTSMTKGSSAWTATVTCAEGTNTIYLQATDAAGNTTVSGSTTITAHIDTIKPVVAVTKVNGTDATGLESYYTTSGVVVEGTVTDLNLNTFTVTPSSGSITMNTTPTPGVNNAAAWKFTIPEAGAWNITLTAMDEAGLTTTQTFSTIIDSAEPVLTSSVTDSTWFTTLTPTLKVHVADTGTAGTTYSSGIKDVQYAVESGTAADMLKGEYSSSGYYYDYNKNYTFAADGHYSVIFTAEDNAGNSATQLKKTYNIDTTAPSTTLTSNVNLYDTAGANGTKTLTAGTTYITKDGFTLGGVITETNFSSAELSITKDGTEVSGVTSPTASGSWSYSQTAATNHTDDGLYVYTLTITDEAGNTTAKTVNVRVDTTGPVLDVTSPAADESVESDSKTIKGTASDTGAGVKSVYYELRKSDNSTIVTTDGSTDESKQIKGTVTLTGESWSKSIATGAKEGTLNLYVKATDVLSHTTEETISFYYDKSNPSLTEAYDETTGYGIGVSGKTTNAKFTLYGTASDTNALATKDESNSVYPLTVVDTVDSTTAGTYYPTVSDGKWSCSLIPTGTTGDVVDGTHVYTITARDAAGKTTTLTRTVVADATKPTWKTNGYENRTPYFTTSIVGGYTGWYYRTTSIIIDALAADETSGVAKLQYNPTEGTESIDANYIDTGNGNFTITAKEGTNTVYVRAVDAAGNRTEAVTITANVDTTAPDTCTLGTVDGVSGVSTKLTNGKSNITFTFTAADSSGTNPSGIYSAALSKIGSTAVSGAVTATGTSGEYSVTIPAADLTVSGTVTVKLTDTAGNTASFGLFSIDLDTTAPVVKISSPTASSTVNKKISLSGTASDNKGLDFATLAVSKDDSAYTKIASYSSSASSNTLSIGSDNTWAISSFDTTNYYPDSTTTSGTLYFKLSAEDDAGNTDSTTTSVTVNQNADRPVIKISNLTGSGSTIKYTTEIRGTIIDDDGISTFKVSPTSITSSTDWLKYKQSGTLSLESDGTWSYTPSGGDGTNTVYLYVKDTAGTEFWTAYAVSGTADTLYMPYILYEDAAANADNTEAITYTADSEPPSIDSIKIRCGTASTLSSASYSDCDTTKITGGSNKYIQLQITSSDACGIAASTAVQIKDSDDTAYTTLSGGTYSISNTVWTSAAIDISKYATGLAKGSVTVYDVTGFKTVQTYSFAVDNTAPSVTPTSPTNASDSTASSVTSGITLKGTVSDTGGSSVSKVQWMIPTATQRDEDDDTLAGESSSWSTNIFSSGVSFEAVIPEATIKTYDTSSYYLAVDSFLATYDNSTVFRLPVYYRVEDSTGNVLVYRNYSILHNPDADRPTCEVQYPETGAIMGVGIRISGKAEDNVSVKSVYLQIDYDGDGKFENGTGNDDKGALAALTYNGSTVYTVSVLDDLGSVPNRYDASSCPTGVESDWWGIKASDTTSWYETINKYGELDASSGTTRTIYVRACSVDNNNKISVWSTAVKIIIDTNAPVLGNHNLYLAHLDSITGETGSDTYEAYRYIQNTSENQWYLAVSAEDNNTVDDKETTIYSSADNADYTLVYDGSSSSSTTVKKTTGSWSSDSVYGYIYYIPVPTDASSVKFKVNISDGSAASQGLYYLNIDNTAPTIGTPQHNSAAVSTANVIQNSNYCYTFSDAITDAGSGFEKMLFYFVRNPGDTTNGRIYDPMITHNEAYDTSTAYTADNSLAHSRVNLSDMDSEAIASTTLYGKTYTGGTVTASTYEQDDISDNAHVRDGGLIYIGGMYRTITALSTDTVTFSPVIEGTYSSYTTAFFPYCQVVDNTGTEEVTSKTNHVFTISGDDGDGMPEIISQTTTTWTCKPSIFADNMPDGPVTLVVIAFDEAGNISTTTVSTKIESNPPRLAVLYLGTDLNGDNAINKTEFNTYSVKSDSSIAETDDNGETAVANGTIDTSKSVYGYGKKFIVKNGLAVIPEFVGGNGDIYCVFSKYATLTQAATGTVGTTVGTNAVKLAQQTTFEGYSTATNFTSESGLLVPDSVFTSGSDGTGKYMGLTFWDSTEECTAGSDTQSCWVNVYLDVDVTDSDNPTASITPFYWNSSSRNSLYGGSTDNGHIELPAHLATVKNTSGTAVFTSNATDGEYDLDPKVSGKIRIEGTAYDETRLSKLYASFDGIKINGVDAGKKTLLATYTPETDYYTAVTSDDVYDSSTTYYTKSGSTYTAASITAFASDVTYYTKGDWLLASGSSSKTAGGVIDSDGWTFRIVSDSLTQSGHTVHWKLDIDTQNIANGAGLDKRITIYADDAAYHSVSKTYQVDVVPYITSVTTDLSSYYGSAPSVYARTSQGHYPVREGEGITINGFNIISGSTVTVNGTALSALDSKLETNITSSSASGNLVVTTGTVSSLNDCNTAPAYDSDGDPDDSGAAYNAQPNGVNNNLLTDDAVLDVWQFKDAAEPVSGKAQYVTMKINPKTGIPGFSFANSILYFNMPGYASSSSSYNNGVWYWAADSKVSGSSYSQLPVGMNYGGFSQNTFAFDSYGYSYGAAMCTDTQKANASAFFQFFSRESAVISSDMDQNMNYCNSMNASRLDSSSVEIADYSWTTDIDRIQSPSMETSYSGGSSTAPTTSSPVYVFIAYYDEPFKQVRFRWGTVGATTDNIDGQTNNNITSTANAYTQPSSFANRKTYAYGLDDAVNSRYTGYAQAAKNDGVTRPSNVTDSYLNYSYSSNSGIPVQVVAASGVSGAKAAYSSETTYGAGKYVSLSIVGKDTASPVAVVSWYDSVHMKLCMAYNTAPASGNTWTTRVIDSNGGINVKTAVDGDGGIHFAYYDNIKGSNLKYAYLSSYDTTNAPQVVTVDAFGSVGAKCTIDVAKVNGVWMPYIGYQLNSYLGTPLAAKMAYCPDWTSTAVPSGADSSDFYTGKWETTIVPTKNIPTDDQINIGLYKTSVGVAQAFISGSSWTTGDTSPGSPVNNTTLNVCNATILHGNNTANPIIGYGIDTGAIEMGQKK